MNCVKLFFWNKLYKLNKLHKLCFFHPPFPGFTTLTWLYLFAMKTCFLTTRCLSSQGWGGAVNKSLGVQNAIHIIYTVYTIYTIYTILHNLYNLFHLYNSGCRRRMATVTLGP